MNRYARQIEHPGFGIDKQIRLKNSTVLVAGIGGLGGAAAWSLAGAGIGKMVLVHAGNLDKPDLNRQTLMTHEWIGKSRVEKARETLLNFNPEIEITTCDFWINTDNFHDLLKQHKVNFVIDARHNFKERRIINDVCVRENISYTEAAMNGMDGYVFAVNPGKSACLNCVYPEDPPDWDPFGFPVFGAVASATGSMAGLLAIQYLSGYHENIFGILTNIDFSTLRSYQYRLGRDKACSVCGGLK